MPVMTCAQRSRKFSQSSRYASIERAAARSERSAAAVGRVRPGADEQRHVVVLVGGGDAEVERHVAEERRIGERRAAGREVRGDREDEAVSAGPMLGAFEERRAGAAVGIEDERLQLAR